MRSIHWLSLSILLSWIGTSAAFAWVPVACANRVDEIESLRSSGEKEDVRESWKRFSETVRSARPGSSVYAPKPYPQSRADILEDFEYAFRSTLVGNTPASELPEGVADVYRALERGTLDIEILRVENWGLSRCGGGKLKPFSHLLRLRERESGREIGRITVHDSGLWGQFRPIPESAEGHASLTIPPLADFQGFLSRQFGFRQPVQKIQYVAADGLSHCSPVVPCVAFQAQGKVYLVDAGRLLYEVKLADGLVSVTEHRSRARGPRTLAPDLEAPLVSVGFAWAQARRVAGQLEDR